MQFPKAILTLGEQLHRFFSRTNHRRLSARFYTWLWWTSIGLRFSRHVPERVDLFKSVESGVRGSRPECSQL